MQSYQHFTLTERESLQEKLKEGKSVTEIAMELGRNKSSVSREIKRNKNKDGGYHPWRATVLYIQRRKSCKRIPRLKCEELRVFVENGFKQYWSPEIITAKWKLTHPGSKLSHSTIYRALKRKELPDFSPKTHLRRHGKRKNTHNSRTIHPDYKICDRPPIVDERVLDNGSEFAGFRDLQETYQTKVFFADPHSPWQCGSNENTNGLLRFFFPKGTDFLQITEEKLQNVLSLINNRPRKCLGWLSPLEFVSCNCCT
jgi:IS30 family transposase